MEIKRMGENQIRCALSEEEIRELGYDIYSHRSSDRSFDTTIDPCKDDRFDHKWKECSCFFNLSIFYYAGSNRRNGISQRRSSDSAGTENHACTPKQSYG